MNKEELKQYIDDNIYENPDGEITGEALNEVLKAIVDDGGTEVEANPTGEATTPLNKIKIRETNYNIPQTDTSTLATKQELQQGLSGKQDIISDLQQIRTRADEGHTALQPIQDATPSNFVIFDENGGIKDSGKKDTNFATAAQGTKADNAIPMPTGTDGQILEKDSNETSGVKWVNKPSDGKSAYQLYVDGGGTLTQEQWLASLKANIGEFLFVPTDAAAVTAMATIGQTYSSAIDPLGKNVAPSQNTLSVILLMNDDATTPTKTMMIATQDDGSSGFEFVYAGDLQSAMPSNVLTETDIDDTHLVNPVSGSLAKAEDVMQLKAKLEGVTAEETKVVLGSEIDKAINGNNGELCTDSYGKHYEIAIGSNVTMVRFLATETSGSSYPYGYAFYNENDVVIDDSPKLYAVNSNSSTRKVYEIITEVPSGAAIFKASTSSLNREGFYCYLQSGESVGKMIEALDLKTNGKDYTEIKDINNTTNWSNTVYGCFYPSTDLDKVVYKQSNVGSYTSKYYDNYFKKWKKEGSKLRITANSSYTCYVTFLTSFNNIGESGCRKTLQQLLDGGYLSSVHIDSAVFTIPSGETQEFEIPEDCMRIVLTKYFYKGNDDYGDVNVNRLPSEIMLITDKHIEGNLDQVKKDIQDVDDKVNRLEIRDSQHGIVFYNGTFDKNGNIIANNKYAFSTPISYAKPFYIELHEGYALYRVRLFNAKDELVTFNERVYTSSSTRVWGLAPALPQYYVRIEVIRANGNDVDINDNIVKRFYNFEGYKRVIPEGIPTECWKIFQSRVMQITNPTWYALNRVLQNSTGYAKSSYFFLQGSTNRGIPYSEPSKYSKYVGQNVSFRTFLTALLNKRSVMYTEDIEPSRNKSSYGIDYSGGLGHYSSCYYGTVCTGFTSYLAGTLGVIQSSGWTSKTGMKSIGKGTNGDLSGVYQYRAMDESNWTVANNIDKVIARIQPGDIIKTDGHCFAISDMYLESDDSIKFVFVAEQTTPRGCITPYPYDKFKERLVGLVTKGRNFVVTRQTEQQWRDRLTEVGNFENDFPYIQMNKDEYTPSLLGIDPDISTFAGEYASFIADNRISNNNNYAAFLNIHRGNADGDGYTKLLIYDEDDDSLSKPTEYSLLSGAWISDSVKDGNGDLIYSDDASDKDDWIIFDLKKITTLLSAGKYKARVSNADGSKTSGFTHWEMISINLTAAEHEEDEIPQSFSFSYSENATPYMVAWEGDNGMLGTLGQWAIPTQGKVTLDTENHTGTIITPSEGTISSFVKLYVRGDYGDVVMRVRTNGTEQDQEGDDGVENNE